MIGRSRRRALATADDRLRDLPVIDLPGGLRVHRAQTWAARRDGLSGLPDLPEDSALWIVPCRSIHTFGMTFALDLLWVGRDGDIVDMALEVAPKRQRTALRARSVVEVRAGRGETFADAVRVAGGLPTT